MRKAITNSAAHVARQNTMVQLSLTAIERAMAPPKLQRSTEPRKREVPD
jgi:hypothetical protein